MTLISTRATSPDVRSAIKAVVRYVEKKATSFSKEEEQCAKQLIRHLRQLENDSNHLIGINNKLMDLDGHQLHFDDETGTMTMYVSGKICSRIPFGKGASLTKESIVAKASYNAGDEDEDVDIEKLRQEMQSKLMSYYYTAALVSKNIYKLVRANPKNSNRKKWKQFNGVNMVRHHLIEHSDKEGLQLSLDTFGYSNNGPVIKPTQLVVDDKKNFNDLGLVPNTNELIESIIKLVQLD